MQAIDKGLIAAGADRPEADYPRLLEYILDEVRRAPATGRVAAYIPELARVEPGRLGIAVATMAGSVHTAGDADTPFSIQSISKLFALVLALQSEGDALWERIGREPSGTPFNSLVQLESEGGKPRNPFVNAGALTVVDLLCSRFAIPENAVIDFLQRTLGQAHVRYDDRVARSERAHADRNAAMAHLMKSFGRLRNPVDAVLDAYCRQCAIELSCVDLARAALFLANGGQVPASGERVLDASLVKRVNALMLTCGTYDTAGDFAFRVGLPAKSGVGGGIVAVAPGECAICVWSPRLDHSGNSAAGVSALELLTKLTDRSIF